MQANLFSPAIDYKARALTLLDACDFREALECLKIAKEIDDHLADLDLLLSICRFAQYHGAHAKMTAAKSAALWHAATEAFQKGDLHFGALKHLRQIIAHRLLSGEFTAAGFCAAREQIIHRGVCHLMLGQWPEAHHALLDLATNHTDSALPIHWGYLGDAAYMLNHRHDVNLAYLRLLISDPHAADVSCLKHPELAQTLRTLEYENDDQRVARALWPFETWRKKIVHIPSGNTFLLPLVQRRRSLLGSELMLERSQKLQQFSLCLYVDQSRLHKSINFDARVEMKTLEPDLFAEYLAEIDRRQREAAR